MFTKSNSSWSTQIRPLFLIWVFPPFLLVFYFAFAPAEALNQSTQILLIDTNHEDPLVIFDLSELSQHHRGGERLDKRCTDSHQSVPRAAAGRGRGKSWWWGKRSQSCVAASRVSQGPTWAWFAPPHPCKPGSQMK